MNITRAELAERLLPHLSLTVGRGCVELLTLASLPTTGGWAQSAAVALADLGARGLARHQAREGQVKAHYFAAVPATSASEEVALPDLDATLTLTTTTGRPHGAPTDRVTLAITVTLGASWPSGTTPPCRWSKACLAPHAPAELPAIRATGIDRMRSALLALRSAPSSTHEVPTVSKKKITPILVDQLLAYCAGVENGPREGSIHLWLRTRGIPRVDAETLLESLVQERRLERRERSVAGEAVIRYVVADPSVTPAPLPRSDAPEPPANDDVDPGDPTDDEGAEDDPAAAFDEDPPEEACRSCAELRQAHGKIEHQLWEAESRAAGLQEKVEDWDRRHKEQDRAHFREVSDLKTRIEGWREQLAIVTCERDEALREAQSLTAQVRPTVDGGTLASYLTRLTDDQWLVVQRGRAQLAEARDLRAKAAELEEEGTRTLEALLNEKPGQAPASPPLPPVEAPPVAAPSGERVHEEEAPAGPRWTSPPAYGETRTRIEEVLQGQPTITLPELLEVCCVSMSGARSALNKLEHEGKITISRGSPWTIAALRALKALPHGTLLVADDGRVLGWSSAPLKATARAPRTVDPVTGEPTGRTAPISQDLAAAPLLRSTKATPTPRPCAREGCDQQARGDVRARYCSDRCRRLVNWTADNARRRAS